MGTSYGTYELEATQVPNTVYENHKQREFMRISVTIYDKLYDTYCWLNHYSLRATSQSYSLRICY